jgi:adenylate cyclase
MDCPACGHANRTDARFCEQCGAATGRHCASCGRELRPTARFCDACGSPVGPSPDAPARDPRAYTPRHLADRILASRSALEGERKQVTVLFADVRGSVELSSALDPEEWHRLLDRFFEILAEGVHRYEGTVNQYTGDGIMALFGAPLAHEDHAQRACFAALRLRDELRRFANELRLSRGLDFAVRIGLHSGEVVVGKIGDDLRMDYTAQGAVVGLAARLQGLAEAGTVYASSDVARRVEGFFRFTDLGAATLKGIGEPVRVFELSEVGALRTRFDASRARGLTRLVGREAELALLDAALDRLAQGHGGSIGIVGQAGVGKSRLCHELAERARARGILVTVTGNAPYGKSVPLLSFMHSGRALLGIEEQDGPEAAREKIAGRVVSLDPALVEEVPFLCDLLGVPDPARPIGPMAPEARQRRFSELAKRMKQARAARGQAALFINEDLHWQDAASEAVGAALEENNAWTLSVSNFRPEYRPPTASRPDYQQIALQPLTPRSAESLLRELLGVDADGALVGRIASRAGGNPFFAEEIVRTLAESGHLEGERGRYRLAKPIETHSVPETVQAVLAARIDRLGEREKALLGAAAVIGQRFALALLERVSEGAASQLPATLASLARAQLVYEEAIHPDPVWSFEHPLTREVAYGSMLSDRRTRLHVAVARAIDALAPERAEENAALIAYHFEAAGETLDAARWHRRAALRAQGRDPSAAQRHWASVRDLAARLSASEEVDALGLEARVRLLRLGLLLGTSLEEARALLEEGRGLAARSGDRPSLVVLLDAYASISAGENDVDAYLAHAEAAVRLADECGDLALQVAVRPTLVRALLWLGRPREALALVEETLLRVGDDSGLGRGVAHLGGSPRVALHHEKALLLAQLGRGSEARQWFESASELAGAEGVRGEADPLHLALRKQDYAMFAASRGESELSLRCAREALEAAERSGAAYARVLAYQALGAAHLFAGEPDAALAALAEARAIAKGARVGLEYEAQLSNYLALAHARRREPDLARGFAEQSLASARRLHSPMIEINAGFLLGSLLSGSAAAPDRERSEQLLAEAEALAERSGIESFRPVFALERARLAGRRGDAEERRRLLLEAQRLYVAMGATARAEEVARRLARSK